MKIYSVCDPEFKPYGKVLEGYDTKELVDAMMKIDLPESGVAYEPGIASLEACAIYKDLENRGFGGMPVCIAKTQYSLSDNPKVLGRPDGFTLTVRDAYVSAGAGFVVVMTGEIMSMPGLPRVPAAVNIDVNGNGDITGLF